MADVAETVIRRFDLPRLDMLARLHHVILQAGFDPDHVDGMLDIARGDSALLLELRSMLDELEWLLQDLANEIGRRAPELAGLPASPLSSLLNLLHPAWTGRCDAAEI